MKARLFVYGTLRPDENPPKTMISYIPDAVMGHEARGKDGYLDATFSNKGNDLIVGYTLTIDDSELPELDKFEGKEYKRVEVFTSKGIKAFAYEFVG